MKLLKLKTRHGGFHFVNVDHIEAILSTETGSRIIMTSETMHEVDMLVAELVRLIEGEIL